MFRFSWIAPVTAVLLLAAGGVIACGGDDGEPSSTTTTSSSSTTSRPGTNTLGTDEYYESAATTSASSASTTTSAATTSAPAAGGIAVTIIDFGYGPDSINAKVGTPITLNVRNSGNAPHTFTIAGGVADTGTLTSGQSKSVAFTPSAAGTLEFLCTIHGAGTMSGKINVTL